MYRCFHIHAFLNDFLLFFFSYLFVEEYKDMTDVSKRFDTTIRCICGRCFDDQVY